MIEINLVPGPKKKKTAGPSFSLDDLKAALARIRDPLLVAAVAGWVVGAGVIVLFYLTDTRKSAGLETELSLVQNEHRRFSALINQKRRAEQLRDSLVTELNVIRGIDGQRYIWPHIIEEITRALPDYTWIIGVEPLGGGPAAAAAAAAAGATGEDSVVVAQRVRIQVSGRTTDIQAYTRFLRQLANSPWLVNVVAGATNTAVEQDRPVTAFTLTATYQRADSAYIRTAPLLQTLQ